MPRVILTLLTTAIGLAAATAAAAQVTKPRNLPSPSDRLPAPAKITAVQQPNGHIHVVWSGVEGAASYKLSRSVPPVGEAAVSLANPTDTVYLDSGVEGGKTYYYVVLAVNQTGLGGLKASAPPVQAAMPQPRDTAKTETAGPSAPALTAPTNVVAKPYPYMQPTVSWESSEGRARFLVERKVGTRYVSAAPWEPVRSGTAGGLWKCCVAQDRNYPFAEQDVMYRVTAVDTITSKSTSPPTLSNPIATWKIKADPPVLHDTVFTVGQSGRIFLLNTPLRSIKWVSLEPQIVEVDLEFGIMKALRQGSTYILASGSTPGDGVQSHIWRVRVDDP